jgi:hypothetical protein
MTINFGSKRLFHELKSIPMLSDERVKDTDRFMHYTLHGLLATIDRENGKKRGGMTSHIKLSRDCSGRGVMLTTRLHPASAQVKNAASYIFTASYVLLK